MIYCVAKAGTNQIHLDSDEMDEAVNIKLLCYNAAIKRMQKS